MKRSQVAFLIAPLWVPLQVTLFSASFTIPTRSQFHWVVVAGLLSAAVAYLGTYGLGLPLFIFLKSRNWTALLVAIISSAFIGAVTYLIAVACFAIYLGEDTQWVVAKLLANLEQMFPLVVPGFQGALVGSTIWAISRPDK